MVDASSAFQALAGVLSKIGFIFLPLGIGLLWYVNSRQFESENPRRKIMDFCKLAFILFAAAQLPLVLVWLIYR